MNFSLEEIYQKIKDYPIIPVFYHAELEYTQNILQACYAGGMRVFEFTNRGEKALEVFQNLIPFVRENCPDLALGIGTIFTGEEAEKFSELGVDFIVQPIINQEVAKVCQQKNLVWIPGAATLNEIYQATTLGAKIVKIFPGNVVGSGFVKSLRGPMPNVNIMVTGGVNPSIESLQEWFGAGVNAVGIGSQLFQNQNNTDFQSLTEKINQLLQFAHSLKNGK